MTFQYAGDTDSVRYLTTSDANDVPSLQSYNNSVTFRSVLRSTGRHLSHIPWEKVLLILAVTLSVMSFVMSAINFIENGQANTKALVSQDSTNPPHFDKIYYNETSTPYPELQSGSGEGENDNQNSSSPEAVLMEEFNRAEKRLVKALEERISNYTYKFETRTLDMFKELESVRLFYGLTKAEIISVKDTLSEAIRKQNDSWKYISGNGDARETSVTEMMDIQTKTNGKLEELYKVVAKVNDVANNAVQRSEHDEVWKELGGVKEMNETINEIESRLSLMNVQQESTSKTLGRISASHRIDRVLIDRNGKAVVQHSAKMRVMQANLTKAISDTNGNVQRMANEIRQRLASASRVNIGKMNQAVAQLNVALQNVKGQVANSAQQLRTVMTTVNRFRTYDKSMQTITSSLKSLMTSLKGKSDNGWIQAPNGYAYHVTLQLFTSWSDAKTKCRELGASLAYMGPRNNQMHNFLFVNLVEPRGESAWIGLTDVRQEGTWKWIDGSPLEHPNWADGQPNNYNKDNTDQDCGEMYVKDGLWNDRWCVRKGGRQNVALCEKKIPA